MDRATRRVVALAARGLTPREIAERLATTPERVRAVLDDAMRETGARSRLELVVLALRNGLIE